MSGATTRMLEEVVKLQREGAKPFVILPSFAMLSYAIALLRKLGGKPKQVRWLSAGHLDLWTKLRGTREPLLVDHAAVLRGPNWDAVMDYRERCR